jgi:hypothetical protein
MCTTAIYKLWFAMKARCTDPNSTSYPYYGARGITVCAAWRDSFETFLRDVGPRPSRQYTLDRIDNDRGYEPGNVRWATRTTQMRNTRGNRRLTYHGETWTIIEWAERLRLSAQAIRSRLFHGWTVERALSQPVQRRR